MQQVKEKAIELKEDVIVPTLMPEPARRKSVPQVDRQPGWYSVDMDASHSKKEERLTRRRSITKDSEQPKEEAKEESKEESPRVDEAAELKERLSLIEQRERQTLEEKQRLESELKDLTEKYNTDEHALASFEGEKQRFRNLIHVEQKKCFDFQQMIIGLKNQLKSEHESKVQAEVQLDSLKKKSKSDKRKSSKASRSDLSESVPETAAVEPAHASSETPSVWHTNLSKSFTEMVAEAQRDEKEHGKKFSEVVKDSLKAEEPAVVDSTPEFVVIGGDLSSQHVVDAVSAN